MKNGIFAFSQAHYGRIEPLKNTIAVSAKRTHVALSPEPSMEFFRALDRPQPWAAAQLRAALIIAQTIYGIAECMLWL